MAACADLDISFERGFIDIIAHDDASFKILKKYLKTLNGYAGGSYISLERATHETDKTAQTIDKLKELFGEKLIIS